MRQLSHQRVRVALIYNVREEAQHEQADPGLISLPTDLSPSPVTQVNTVVSPDERFSSSRRNDMYAEWDSPETIAAIRTALEERHTVLMVEADENAFEKLRQDRPDVAFNVSEGFHGVSREAQIPAILEMLQIPYLGSDPLTLALCLDKARTKEVLCYHGIATPSFAVVNTEEELDDARVRFPAIVKPLHEGSSKGIYNSSVVRTPDELGREVRTVLMSYHQPALIEEFVTGREFTVAIMGNGSEARCLPVVEINYDVFPRGVNPLYCYEAKWVWDTPDNPLNIFTCPAPLTPDLLGEIESLCLKTYSVLRCRDWARLDVRLDRHGKPNILEVNPLPGILPRPEENSCFPKAARAAGMSYNELVLTVLDIVLARVGRFSPSTETAAPVAV